MKAPVNEFVGEVIAGECTRYPKRDAPQSRNIREWHKRRGSDCNKDWTIPPCHRDGYLVSFFLKVIRFVGTEYAVVNYGMRMKSVCKGNCFPKRDCDAYGLVHDVTMKLPLEERGENYTEKK
jgi:hypothetical protein